MTSHRIKVAISLYLACMVVMHALVFWNARGMLRKGYSDFAIYYCAGKMVRQGLRHQLYDEQAQFRIQQEFASAVAIRQGPLPYNHPPFEALIFAPFARLPYFVGFLLWDSLNLLILLALPFLLRSCVPVLRELPAVGWLCVALAFFPVFVALLQGQDVVLLLLLFALAFRALKRRSHLAAGCWLGLGLFRFQIVLPFLLILVLRRHRHTMLGFALVALGLALISVALVGWNGALAYPAYVWRVETALGNGSIVPSDMPNLRGFIDTVLTAHLPSLFINMLIAVISILLVFWASAKSTASDLSELLDLQFSLAVVVTLLVSYHSLPFDLCLLLLPALLVANHVHGGAQIHGWDKAALLGPIVVLFLSPLLMLLSLRYRQLNFLMPLLGFWAWGISREILHRSRPGAQNALAQASHE